MNPDVKLFNLSSDIEVLIAVFILSYPINMYIEWMLRKDDTKKLTWTKRHIHSVLTALLYMFIIYLVRGIKHLFS